MNRQFYGERPIESDNGGVTGDDTPSRPAYSDPYAYKAPVDAVLIPEQPADETVAPEPTLNEPLDQETPMVETPFREIPRWEHVSAVSVVEETVIPAAPVYEKMAYTAPVEETIAEESPAAEVSSASTPATYTAPMAEMVTPAAPVTTPPAAPVAPAAPAALLKHEDSEHFRTRWNEIQGTFVDEPRLAVQLADALVAEVVGQITQMFASEHSTLESQWNQGGDVSTEDLRKALQHYRAFFNRLVV